MALLRIAVATISVLSMATYVHSALGEPDGMPSVGYLANASQLIAVGTLRPQTGNTAQLTIGHMIKGTMLANSVYTVVLRNCPGGPGDVSDKGEYGVWFLEQQSDHILSFSNSPRMQSCPVAEPIINPPDTAAAEWRYDNALSVPDKLAFELAHALVSNTPAGVPIWTINTDAFQGATPDTRHKIMTALSAQESSDLREIGMLGFVESGDPNAIREVHSRGSLNHQPVANSVSSKPQHLMDAIAIKNIFSEDPGTIASLGDIASDRNTNLSLRRSAAEVLRNVHTPQATNILTSLIDDPDAHIREDAVAAIACIANGVPPLDMHNGKTRIDLGRDVPTKTAATLNHFAFGHETISVREAYYVAYWREWWRDNSAAVLSNVTN